MKLAKKLKMQIKQKTTTFKVTGMAKGDYVVSAVSSNKKVLKVSNVKKDGTLKLTAQKKTGTAKLTIKFASGLTRTVEIKTQKAPVKTEKISGLSKAVQLKKGAKKTLKPVLQPITSQQKVTYQSSDKKVAVVSSKGVIKAKRPGKAKITVKSGTKKYIVTIKVK